MLVVLQAEAQGLVQGVAAGVGMWGLVGRADGGVGGRRLVRDVGRVGFRVGVQEGEVEGWDEATMGQPTHIRTRI